MNKLEVAEIQIVPIKPQNGLVAFASCVINDQFYLGNIAILTSPSSPNGFRLQYPTKKLGSGIQLDCFYPIKVEVNEVLSLKVINKYTDLMSFF